MIISSTLSQSSSIFLKTVFCFLFLFFTTVCLSMVIISHHSINPSSQITEIFLNSITFFQFLRVFICFFNLDSNSLTELHPSLFYNNIGLYSMLLIPSISNSIHQFSFKQSSINISSNHLTSLSSHIFSQLTLLDYLLLQIVFVQSIKHITPQTSHQTPSLISTLETSLLLNCLFIIQNSSSSQCC